MRRTGDCKFLHTQHYSQRGFKSAKPCRDGNYCKRLICNFTHLLECRSCKIKCGSPKEMETHMRMHSSRQLVRKGEETMKLENTQKVTKKHAGQEFPDKKQVDSRRHQQHQQQNMMSQRMGGPAGVYDHSGKRMPVHSWHPGQRMPGYSGYEKGFFSGGPSRHTRYLAGLPSQLTTEHPTELPQPAWHAWLPWPDPRVP
jgi:hypothetical protein